VCENPLCAGVSSDGAGVTCIHCHSCLVARGWLTSGVLPCAVCGGWCQGGGSANKTYLYQETKALLNPESLAKFVAEKIKTIGEAGVLPGRWGARWEVLCICVFHGASDSNATEEQLVYGP
jgi:hypothetical protein